MKYKVMCWDSVDNKCNKYDITSYSEAEKIKIELETSFPKYTFEIYKDLSKKESDEELKNILRLSGIEK